MTPQSVGHFALEAGQTLEQDQVYTWSEARSRAQAAQNKLMAQNAEGGFHGSGPRGVPNPGGHR